MILSHKKALITGGTRGIGKAIAKAFVQNGADVYIVGTNPSNLKSTTEELNANICHENQVVNGSAFDVSSHLEVSQFFERTHEAIGSFDIIVNNAGITRDQFLIKMSEKDWDDVLDVNLKSVYNICHFGIKPMLKKRSGKIINISSVIGLTGNPGQVNYSASKFGVIGFTRSLAIEVAKRAVSVNCIAPGFIETDMTGALSEAQKEELYKKIPMQRFGQPDDIAQTALFLASSMSDYITGQVICVDGGMLA